jgi:hypothetical protein
MDKSNSGLSFNVNNTSISAQYELSAIKNQPSSQTRNISIIRNEAGYGFTLSRFIIYSNDSNANASSSTLPTKESQTQVRIRIFSFYVFIFIPLQTRFHSV